MPYTIVKTGPSCYKVKSGGKFHSKKCMTLKNAIAQKLIMERASKEKGEKV